MRTQMHAWRERGEQTRGQGGDARHRVGPAVRLSAQACLHSLLFLCPLSLRCTSHWSIEFVAAANRIVEERNPAAIERRVRGTLGVHCVSPPVPSAWALVWLRLNSKACRLSGAFSHSDRVRPLSAWAQGARPQGSQRPPACAPASPVLLFHFACDADDDSRVRLHRSTGCGASHDGFAASGARERGAGAQVWCWSQAVYPPISLDIHQFISLPFASL